MLVGVIADTHGYIDPGLSRAFAGVERILHAGDIGSLAVLEALGAIATVIAVRGNVDRTPSLMELPELVELELDGVDVQLVHRLPDARPTDETRVVICGHSHRAEARWQGSILYLNPGAAGRQGFHRLRTAALLRLDRQPTATVISLGPRAVGPRAGTKKPAGH